ncbi:MAG: ABC transporter substrate-binding protein [Deltaproteobacteria bacterium]|nr:ABC transporter substrate-binding protein [Deltaproteobacteria bacterium]
MNKITGLIISAVLLSLILSGCVTPPGSVTEPSSPMRIGTSIWTGYSPLYLAKSLGYLDNQPVRLMEYANCTEVVKGFSNSAIEAAALTLDDVFRLAQDGLDPVIILVTDVSNGADALIGRKGMKSVADLKGKKIGVETNAVGAYTLTRAVQLGGLALSDVISVNMTIDEHFKAFEEGRVDAVVTCEPVKTQLIKKGAVVLFDSTKIPGEIVDVIVVRRNYLHDHPEQIKSLLQNWFKALAYIKSNPQDAAQRMAVRENLTPDQMGAALAGIIFPDREENRVMITGGSSPLIPAAERLKRVMIEQKLLQKDIDIKLLFPAPAPVGHAVQPEKK